MNFESSCQILGPVCQIMFLFSYVLLDKIPSNSEIWRVKAPWGKKLLSLFLFLLLFLGQYVQWTVGCLESWEESNHLFFNGLELHATSSWCWRNYALMSTKLLEGKDINKLSSIQDPEVRIHTTMPPQQEL